LFTNIGYIIYILGTTMGREPQKTQRPLKMFLHTLSCREFYADHFDDIRLSKKLAITCKKSSPFQVTANFVLNIIFCFWLNYLF
jgi:hypothetical protein